ncbi:MAG: hypothetical protein H7Y18_16745 [Clostridiaceae bacterium]|nr:hypothetical protein [Clostridiaceae bacterium]
MILHRNMLIEIENNRIIKTELNFFGKNRKEGSDMVNRNLYLLICDEEVYIKKFNLPKAKGELLYNLVKNELCFSVGNTNNILFDYKVTNHLNECIEVIVFYINSQKIAFLRENNCYKNIKKIILVQFAIKKYYKKSINVDNYIMLFIYDKGLYILAINENNLVANSIIESFSGDEEKLLLNLEIFKNKFSDQLINVKNIYLVDISINPKHEKNNVFNSMVVKTLDKYKKEKLLGSFK